MVGLRHPRACRKQGCGLDAAGGNALTWKTEIFFLICKQSGEPTATKGKKRDNPAKPGRSEGAERLEGAQGEEWAAD